MLIQPPNTAPASAPAEVGFRASAVGAATPVRPFGDEAGSQQDRPGAGDASRSVPAVDREELERATAALNKHFEIKRAALHFSVDDDTERVVVKVVDSRDGTLIRQIPSEEALRLAQALQSETPPLIEQVA
jgi:flagellar protein FlaG